MLRLTDIVKNYPTATTTVQALRGVSLAFREAEFVAILGPSGCGKTTMLNIIGGLDRYTSGDLVIGGVSTAAFDDLHWDAYRNATIGFVFQSYNLIPHLTVIENVELALELVGEKKKTRRAKAIAALHRVGMGDEINKRPNQLSGGQMQRVAIARAIVNDPKIILADEPTGALDSELSVQVMDILREISKTRLVIMVTHNSELANTYCTRICKFKDGSLIDDSNPYDLEEEAREEGFDLLGMQNRVDGAKESGEEQLENGEEGNKEETFDEALTTDTVSLEEYDAVPLNRSDETEKTPTPQSDENADEREEDKEAESGDSISDVAESANGEEGEVETSGAERAEVPEGAVDEEAPKDVPEVANEVPEAIDNEDIEIENLFKEPEPKTKIKKVSNRKRKKQMKRNSSANDPVLNKLGINSLNKRKRKQKKQMKREKTFKPTSMSAGMAFGLSLKNLIAKRKRTFFTVFAGSIGIIGLGLVLSISNGFSVFVDNMQTDMLAGVPVGVYEYNVQVSMLDDIMSMMTSKPNDDKAFPDGDNIVVDESSSSGSSGAIEAVLDTFFKSVTKNDITQEFVDYMERYDGGYGALNEFYGVRYNLITRKFSGGQWVYKDASQMPELSAAMSIAMTILGENGLQPAYWQQLVGDEKFMLENYDILQGRYPQEKNELVLCVDEHNSISRDLIDTYGFKFYERDENGDILTDVQGEPIEVDLDNIKFSNFIGKKIRLVLNNDYYIPNSLPAEHSGYTFYDQNLTDVSGNWSYNNQEILRNMFDKTDPDKGGNGINLVITGVMRPKKDAKAAYVTGGSICYTSELAKFVAEDAYQSDVAKLQRLLIENEGYDVDEATGTKTGRTIFEIYKKDEDIKSSSIGGVMKNKLALTSYEKAIGATMIPTYIAVYPRTYQQKLAIGDYIEAWNDVHSTAEDIGYFDVSEMMVHSLNMIINLVSILLIAVASISLVVSTVMIGVITSNSVIERTREIGILRALGARKRDIRNVFVAETALIGLAAGVLGIVVTYVLAPLISLVIGALSGVANLLNFHPLHAFILVALSLVLTVISGIVPAINASRKNVVDALRVE